jgi:hypothetical protein
MNYWGLITERFLITCIRLVVIIAVLATLTSCGTLLGGKRELCQTQKPPMATREIRPWAFAADLLLAPIALPIDFYTGGIYKPCSKYKVKVYASTLKSRRKRR